MKKTSLTLIFLLVSHFIFSQSNVLTSGKEVSSNSGTVTYSVGLVNFKEATGSGGSLHHGIQHISEIVNVLHISEVDAARIKLFPNPTIDYIVVDMPDVKNLEYRIVSILGQELLTGEINKSQDRVDLKKLRTGTYFFILYRDSKKVATYQIVKQ